MPDRLPALKPAPAGGARGAVGSCPKKTGGLSKAAGIEIPGLVEAVPDNPAIHRPMAIPQNPYPA